MTLSIADYDKAEALARITACYPAIRAFTPTTFLRDGVPTNATCEAELARYVDMMGEVWAFKDWDKALFTEKEIGDINWLKWQVEVLTEKLFGTRITPISNLLSPWPVLRTVRHISQGRPLRVFEIAAGCGYLGAYLIRDGHFYIGTDVTQGLWLWQDRLWSSIDSHLHWKWWDFAQHNDLPPVDIVICDSALGEMNWFGYYYTIAAATRMIGDEGCFIFSNIGDHTHRTPSQVRHDLLKSDLTYNKSRQDVMVWSKNGVNLKEMGDPYGIKLSSLGLIPDKLPENYAFLKFAGLA